MLVCFSADADDGFRQIHQNFLKELSRSTLIFWVFLSLPEVDLLFVCLIHFKPSFVCFVCFELSFVCFVFTWIVCRHGEAMKTTYGAYL